MHHRSWLPSLSSLSLVLALSLPTSSCNRSSSREGQPGPTSDKAGAAKPTPSDDSKLVAQRAETRGQLATARDRQVARLGSYRQAEAFPRNQLALGTIPIFVDEGDVACAVGYLMREDGERDAVAAIVT